LRVVAVVQDKVLVHGGFGFCPLGERGLWDLTQRMVINRHVGLPLSKWRGHGVDFFSWLDDGDGCPS